MSDLLALAIDNLPVQPHDELSKTIIIDNAVDEMDFSIMTNDQTKHRITGRPNQVPTDVAAELERYGLQILSWQRSAGPSINRSHVANRETTFYSLCQLIDGDGWYLDPDTDIPDLPRGSCVLACPGDPFGYGGVEKGWIEDFITFTGPRADQLHRTGVIRTGVFASLNLHALQEVIEAVLFPDLRSQLKANSLLQLLLIELCQANAQDSDMLEQRIRRLLQEIATTPGKWWTVAEMAGYCGASQVHLRRVFKRLTGTSPKRYLERVKMGVAADLLCQSDTAIGEIARHLDYHDPYHFSRRFKIVMGLSPQHYRTRYGHKIG